MDHDTIWARSTIEQLLSRQVVPPRPCDALHSTGAAARASERGQRQGVFRPGLRVVAIDEAAGPRAMDHWLDHPAGAIVEG